MVRFNPKFRDLSHYRIETSIGKGGFGKVNCVTHLPSGKLYAMKTLNKAACFDNQTGVQQVFNELHILSSHTDPFLCNAHCAFQDDENLYLVMDLALGGDLKYQLMTHTFFSEHLVKFVTGCVVIAVEFLHSRKVLHRDIKPANMLMKSDGYVILTDFGLSTNISSLDASEVSGTDGYIAPEMYHRRISPKHTSDERLLLCSDWFAIGVCCFQFAVGDRPWNATKELTPDSNEYEKAKFMMDAHHDLSPEFRDFVTQLIHAIPEKRMGFKGGAAEVMSHPWFDGFDWQALRDGRMPAPYKPDITRKNVDRRISVMDLEEQLVGFKADVPRIDKSRQVHFENYHWHNELTQEDLGYLSKKSGCAMCVIV